MRWSDWLYKKVGRTHAIALNRLAEALSEYLTGEIGVDQQLVAEAMARDLPSISGHVRERTPGLRRQARHLA